MKTIKTLIALDANLRALQSNELDLNGHSLKYYGLSRQRRLVQRLMSQCTLGGERDENS